MLSCRSRRRLLQLLPIFMLVSSFEVLVTRAIVDSWSAAIVVYLWMISWVLYIFVWYVYALRVRYVAFRRPHWAARRHLTRVWLLVAAIPFVVGVAATSVVASRVASTPDIAQRINLLFW